MKIIKKICKYIGLCLNCRRRYKQEEMNICWWCDYLYCKNCKSELEKCCIICLKELKELKSVYL